MPTKQTPAEVLCSGVKQLAPKFDTEAFEVAIACIKAQEGNGSTVWLNLFAPPSSGKTVILDAFPSRKLPEANDPVIKEGILILDSLTPRTLISGLANMNKPGLLERIESCSLLIKDLAPFAANHEAREIFSQLRRVFDGELSMPFGSGKAFSWQGRLTILCASVAHLSSLDAELGARLLSISLRPIEFSQRLAEGKKELKTLVTAVLSITPVPVMTREMYQMCRPYARAIGAARAFVRHDPYDREVHDLPIEEQPHRLTNQLAALAAGLCALRQCQPKETVPTLERIAIESIPPFRRAVLGALAKCPNGLSMTDVVKNARVTMDCKVSESSVRRAVSDLSILQLIDDETLTPNYFLPGAVPAWVRRDKRWPYLTCIEKGL